MPSWPTSLPPAPLRDGFSEQPPDLVVRSQTDVGPAKTRRRATVGPTRFGVTLRLSTAQLATFRTFLEDELHGRALSFAWVHPVTGEAASFRIVEPPKYEPLGLSWGVALSLEMLP